MILTDKFSTGQWHSYQTEFLIVYLQDIQCAEVDTAVVMVSTVASDLDFNCLLLSRH